MEKLKFGILGSAGIAWKQFIPAIALAKNAEIIAVASRSEEKSKFCGKISYSAFIWIL